MLPDLAVEDARASVEAALRAFLVEADQPPSDSETVVRRASSRARKEALTTTTGSGPLCARGNV